MIRLKKRPILLANIMASKLRTESDDLVLYQPYHTGNQSEEPEWNLRFLKVSNHYLAKSAIRSAAEASADVTHQCVNPLRTLPDVCGYKTVFMPGKSPCFVIKSSTSLPHVLALRGKPVRSLSSFNIPACERGFVYIDSDVSFSLSLR
jgi:cleavage and polyadenylation specificity factor subunit 1